MKKGIKMPLDDVMWDIVMSVLGDTGQAGITRSYSSKIVGSADHRSFKGRDPRASISPGRTVRPKEGRGTDGGPCGCGSYRAPRDGRRV